MKCVFKRDGIHWISVIAKVVILTSFVTVLSCKGQQNLNRTKGGKSDLAPSDLVILDLAPNMDSNTVIVKIGRPDSVKSLRNDDIPSLKTQAWFYPACTVFLNSKGLIDGFAVGRPGVRTKRGLSVGDSLSRVQRLYGNNGDDYGPPTSILHFSTSKPKEMMLIISIEDSIVTNFYVGRTYKK